MLRPRHILILAASVLLVFGVIMVHSMGLKPGAGDPAVAWQLESALRPPAESLGGVLPDRRHWELFRDMTTVYALGAVLVMLVCSRIRIDGLGRPQRLNWLNPLVFVLGFAVLLCFLPHVPALSHSNSSEMGAARWIRVGSLSMQPSEVLKWTFVAFMAFWCHWASGRMSGRGVIPALGFLGLATAVILSQRDLGTAAVVGTAGLAVMLCGGMRIWHAACLAGAGLAGLVLMVAIEPYRLARIMAFLDPWEDQRGSGFHPIQSMFAFCRGGLTGRGLGNGTQKYMMPESTNDFIFPNICEEMGLVGALVIVLMVLSILWAGIRIARARQDTFGRLFCFGVTFTFALQATINIAVATVMMPTKGIALPLVSQGGTGWLMTAIALGLVAALDLTDETEDLPPAAAKADAQPAAAPAAASADPQQPDQAPGGIEA